MSTSPIRPTDDEARVLAHSLMQQARFAALGVIDDHGAPMVTRVAFGRGPDGQPMTLVSDLSAHTRALKARPQASLLVGEPADKGDPLTHPRLTLQVRAQIVPHADPRYGDLAGHYLKTHPKAKLYIGFADFNFMLFTPQLGLLNGGFGKAYELSAADLTP
ncbi:MAG: pyridoxamine 5'-phosphate oxidase family protein [Rhodobacteraceae bacterium]|nr:pyridoxamine 5'-phosphate oxidase family protein [Paracoccaceae bacterium]